MNPVSYSVAIDWNCTDWAGVHDFTGEYDDISSYVLPPVRIARDKKPDDWVYPAATLELKLNNASKIFYPTYAGPLQGLIRPWLPIRVIATHNEIEYPLYYGYLCKLVCHPIKDKKHVYLYATDGIDALAKAIIIQDMDDKTVMADGGAVDLLLTKGGWSTLVARRTIDMTGGDIIKLPDTFTYEKGE
jgi:hypothetical protein